MESPEVVLELFGYVCLRNYRRCQGFCVSIRMKNHSARRGLTRRGNPTKLAQSLLQAWHMLSP